MSMLNRPAYKMEKDKLIYDASHPIDATAIEVTLDGTKVGTIKRGQLIDYADGTYSIHKEAGTASVIAAEDVDYAEDDTVVTVPVYISGTFRMSEIISDPEVTAADAENIRAKGIYLK